MAPKKYRIYAAAAYSNRGKIKLHTHSIHLSDCNFVFWKNNFVVEHNQSSNRNSMNFEKRLIKSSSPIKFRFD